MKNIEENNVLIADFSGWQKSNGVHYDTPHTQWKWQSSWLSGEGFDTTNEFLESELKFNKSWDWLMPVVSKCYEYGELDNHYREEIIASLSGVIDIEDTYNAVVDFVKWYNDNNKPI